MADELGAERDFELHARIQLVRELNAAIRGAGRRFGAEGDLVLDFYCECGCWEIVQVSVAEYDRQDGRRLYRQGHPG